MRIEEWRLIVTDVKVNGTYVSDDFEGARLVGLVVDDERAVHPMPNFGSKNRFYISAPSSEYLGDMLRKLRAEQDKGGKS